MGKVKSLAWSYYYSDSQEHVHAMDFFTGTQDGKVLDCGGEDAGKAECWHQGVNIGVPVACCAIFLLVIIVIFVTSKPKKSIYSNNEQANQSADRKMSSQADKETNPPSVSTVSASGNDVGMLHSTQTIDTCISVDDSDVNFATRM